MKFLNNLCGRPHNEKPIMILPVGHPIETANLSKAATLIQPLKKLWSVFQDVKYFTKRYLKYESSGIVMLNFNIR